MEHDPTRTATLRASFKRTLQTLPLKARRRALETLRGYEAITDDTVQAVIAVVEEELGPRKAVQVIDRFLPIAYKRGATFAIRRLRAVGVQVDLGILIRDPENVAALRGLSLDLVKSVAQDSKKALRQTLVRANLENWSRRDLVAQIKKDFNVPVARAQSIARTETIRAFNTGAVERYKAAGYEPPSESPPVHPNCRCTLVPGKDKRLYWLTAADERTCPICEPKDGKPV